MPPSTLTGATGVLICSSSREGGAPYHITLASILETGLGSCTLPPAKVVQHF